MRLMRYDAEEHSSECEEWARSQPIAHGHVVKRAGRTQVPGDRGLSREHWGDEGDQHRCSFNTRYEDEGYAAGGCPVDPIIGISS